MCLKIPNLCGFVHAELDYPLNDVMEQHFSQDLNRIGARHFVANTPEFFPCDENAERLQDWINMHGAIGSEKNFAIAYGCLRNVLIQRPVPPSPPQADPRAPEVQIIFIPDSRGRETLETYADKKYESDVARKKRDENLRQEYLETLRNKGEWIFE